MKDTIIYFFTDSVAFKVLIGITIISATSGIVGTFSFLRKKTLVGDAIAHSLFPGICLGFIFSGTKDPFYLMSGALITGWLSIWLIDVLTAKSKLSSDTSIAFVSTFFFAIGSVLLSFISSSTNGNQSGLKDFLFGKAATMSNEDINVFVFLSLIILLIVILFFKYFQLISFNKEFAKSIGIKVNLIEFLLSTITVLTVAIGIQSVGVVLTSALLIAPAATARYWTNNLPKMLFYSALIGVLSGVLGVFISSTKENMPTGPWIVFILFFFTLMTLLFSSNRGWFSMVRKQRINRKKMAEENVLKVFYQLAELGIKNVTYSEFLNKRQMDTKELTNTIASLIKKGFINNDFQFFKLSEKGEVEAARIVRFHRLWELYLTKRLNFKEDHIHGTAETIEHLITPEIEKELLKELKFPKADPHNKIIPY